MNASSNYQQQRASLRLAAEREPGPVTEADQTAAFTAAMYQAAIAEGERRVYARLGIPQPLPPSPARVRHLAAAPEPEIELEAE